MRNSIRALLITYFGEPPEIRSDVIWYTCRCLFEHALLVIPRTSLIRHVRWCRKRSRGSADFGTTVDETGSQVAMREFVNNYGPRLLPSNYLCDNRRPYSICMNGNL